MKYIRVIINSEVIFDMNSCELINILAPNESIILNVPTARCLQLLLERRGKTISREDFLEQVWNTRGIVVSQNTFYQNISLLRKSLKKAGLHEDVIITVRRKGFVLSMDTLIESLSEKNPHPEDHPPRLASRYLSVDEIATTGNNQGLEVDCSHNKSSEQVYKNKNLSNQFQRSVIVLLAIFIIIEILSILLRYV